MRLYLGSVIINRLPFGWQSGEVCLRYAKAYRLIDNNTRDVEMTRTRVLRQILAHYQTEIQWCLSGFVDSQLFFDDRRQLFTDLVKFFIFQIFRKFTSDLFVTQHHLLVTHIQQTIGVGIGQRPWVVKVGLHRLTQTLGEDAIFIHIDRGTDKFMHMTIVADPQVNGLLTPANNAVELAL